MAPALLMYVQLTQVRALGLTPNEQKKLGRAFACPVGRRIFEIHALGYLRF